MIDSGMYREVTSTTDGTYFVTGIVPGTYEVSAQLQGFKKYVRRDVVLSVGRSTSVDIQLAAGGIEETVNVTAESPLVETTSGWIKTKDRRASIGSTTSFSAPAAWCRRRAA